jgi:glyoxylase-like metal-dependent hydrolase (beta-lactamase superfamily II)/rhodanese-related sulfurtransferase
MKVEQIYTGCLAEAAYYIESDGEAVVIDPLRETKDYIARAEEDGAKIKYVLETHFHADFVSGHLDLAKKTGAKIVYGPTAQPNFDVYIPEDGEILKVGKVTIKVLHTPGHTMESTTYLLRDEDGKDYAIFTGDTLFIGDVGRPDLAVKSDLSREDLAGHLFESLRNKIMPLADDVLVYPGHGAGSACGKKMSDETYSYLGNQKETNYALRADMTKEEFVKEVTTGLVEPPQYFPKNAVMNKMGYESLDNILERGVTPLSVNEFVAAVEATDALILDTRPQRDFPEGFIPGSIWVGVGASDKFGPWVGALVSDLKQPIVYICEEGKEEEVVTRLSRVGYDNALGYLKGGIDAWLEAGKELDTIGDINGAAFESIYRKDNSINVVDVRKESEYDSEHMEGALNLPLDFINRLMDKVDKNEEYFVHCRSGYRSLIAASIFKSRGVRNLHNIFGGFVAMKNFDLPTSEYKEPITEL